jgi:hypothetical protein
MFNKKYGNPTTNRLSLFPSRVPGTTTDLVPQLLGMFDEIARGKGEEEHRLVPSGLQKRLSLAHKRRSRVCEMPRLTVGEMEEGPDLEARLVTSPAEDEEDEEEDKDSPTQLRCVTRAARGTCDKGPRLPPPPPQPTAAILADEAVKSTRYRTRLFELFHRPRSSARLLASPRLPLHTACPLPRHRSRSFTPAVEAIIASISDARHIADPLLSLSLCAASVCVCRERVASPGRI